MGKTPDKDEVNGPIPLPPTDSIPTHRRILWYYILMRAIDMKHVYKNYKGKWVALKSPEERVVVASAKTLKQVIEKARQKGILAPLVTQIPKEVLPIVG